MKNIETMLFGIYPKSESLRIRIGRWERHLLETEELVRTLNEETGAIQKSWREWGVTQWASPLFNWFDIFRPIGTLVTGIELGPLTRYFETNTFYRIPLISEPVALSVDPQQMAPTREGLPLPLYYGNGEWAFLPGIQTLYVMSGTDGINQKQFNSEMASIYSAIMKKTGRKKLFLFEAADAGSFDYSLYSEVCPPSETVVFSRGTNGEDNFSSISEKFHSIIACPGSGKGVELNHSILKGMPIIDAHSTRLEDMARISEMIHNEDEDLLITTNDYLDFLPRIIADQKAQFLGGLSNVR